LGRYGQLIEDTHTRLGSLRSSYVGYIRREVNEVAHCLAKTVVHHSLDQLWTGHCPIFIQVLYLLSKIFPHDFNERMNFHLKKKRLLAMLGKKKKLYELK
jgi:hypothetical protein